MERLHCNAVASPRNSVHFVYNILLDYENKDFFVGGSNANADDITDINQWKFNNGESLPASLWTEPAPDSQMTAGYHCVQLFSPNWNFDDTSCNNDYNYYICEK